MDIVIAFLIDCILGDPYNFPHPVRFIGKYIKLFENKVFNKTRTKIELKYFYGVLLTISTVGLTFILTIIILQIAKSINIYLFYILNIIILWTTIAPKCLAQEGYKVYKPLKDDNIELARNRISFLVSRDTENLSKSQICRATVETILENISDGVIAPLFYAFIGGAPLAMAYKAVNTLDSMVGYRNDKYENFGFFSAKLDDCLNFIPSRLSGILIIISAFCLKYDYRNALKIFIRDRKKHESPNSAHPESAGAGALDIQLGGATSYFGEIHNKPYIGDNIKQIMPNDILKSIKLLYISTIILILIGICIQIR